jgi:UDP-glucose 4-epimerase
MFFNDRIYMKILLTGSEGLIGKTLKTVLSNHGFQIVGFDHKFPATHQEYGNILEPTSVEESISGCEGVVHLAAVSRVIWGEQNPTLCWKTNFEGTQNILNSAFNSLKRPWILYASSREVYGNQNILPVREDAILNPINIYGESKAAAEAIILSARTSGLNTSIVRFSNVYGSIFDHHDRVIPAFCLAAATNRPLYVEGSQNTFDFTHVTDVVAGIFKIIEQLSRNERNIPPLHFTTGRETSLREAAEIANEAGGQKSKIIEAPRRTFDVSNFCGDATQTMKILGWHPKITLEEGILELTSSFKKGMNEFINSKIRRGGYHNENTQSDPWVSSAI